MRRSAGLSFLALCAVELLLLGFLAATHRMPYGHDAFQYFTLQYAFLNNSAQTGEVAYWFPFVVNGSVSSWWYSVQASLLQQVCIHLGFLFRGHDLLIPFYAGIFVDTVLLITGTWLLAARFFSHKGTVFFIAATVAGSTLWSSQPWFGLHFYYALPLILHLLHRFLETGHWRYLFLAVHLLAIQMLGNLLYFLPVQLFVIFLYLMLYGLSNREEFLRDIRSLRWRGTCWIGFGITAVLVLSVVAVLKVGMTDVVQYVHGRNPDGSVPLEVFLTYGGIQNLSKWLELILGVSAGLDYTLYIGLLGVILFGWGAVSMSRRQRHLFWLIPILFALSMGTPLADLLYHLWPLMKFYRHLGLLTCFVKLFSCFVAGAGLDNLFRANPLRGRASMRLLFSAVPLGLLSLFLFYLSRQPEIASGILAGIFSADPRASFPAVMSADFLSSSLQTSATLALLAAFLTGTAALNWTERRQRHLLWLAIFLQICDLYNSKWTDVFLKTLPLTAEQRTLTRQQPIPFSVRRVSFTKALQPRAVQMQRLPYFGGIPPTLSEFLFLDEPGSSYRVDYTQRPMDQFLRAYWKLPVSGDPSKMVERIYGRQMMFQLNHPAAAKISGVSEDKIQFFSRAALASTEADVAFFIADPRYAGDFPVLLPPPYPPPQAIPLLSRPGPSDHYRLHLPYQVLQFDANHLSLSVSVPGTDPVWFLYSDVWHPLWKATVNSQPVPLFRANLAYKALLLPPGQDRIHFFFYSRTLQLLYLFLAFQAAFWILFLIGTAIRVALGWEGVGRSAYRGRKPRAAKSVVPTGS